MSVVINSNIAASIAANNLAYSNQMLQTSLNKLSSGSKIVSPADDAGGLAVSMKLTATVNREGDLQTNLSDATSFAQTQDGALQVAGSIVDRISQLKTLYADPTKNSSDLANYDSEFSQLQTELGSLESQTFNSIALFGSASSGSLTVATTDDLSSANAISVSQQYLGDTSTGVGTLTASSVSASLAEHHAGRRDHGAAERGDHARGQRCGAEPPQLRLDDADDKHDEPAVRSQQHHRCRCRPGDDKPGKVERARPGRHLHADPGKSERPNRPEAHHGLSCSAVVLIRPLPVRRGSTKPGAEADGTGESTAAAAEAPLGESPARRWAIVQARPRPVRGLRYFYFPNWKVTAP